MALNAVFFHPVTMFQPTRPWVKWSKLENRFASKKGGSKDVEAVIPKAKFFVTAAMAEMGCLTVSDFRTTHVQGPTRRTHNGRIRHRPLGSSSDTVVKRALIRIVAAVGISQEERIDSSALEKFGEFNPILQVAFRGRLVFRVL